VALGAAACCPAGSASKAERPGTAADEIVRWAVTRVLVVPTARGACDSGSRSSPGRPVRRADPRRYGANVASGPAVDAFATEAGRLTEIISGVDDAALDRASPCPPWTVRELLCHVRIGVGRVPVMLAEPEPPPGPLIDAPGYYRPDQRFSPAVNDDRIATAQRAAVGAGPAAQLARELDQTWRDAWALMRGAPQGRVVRTRHGDRMLFTEFVRTRVLELAVHGLDLAAGLDRTPWLTGAAAAVVEELVLPAGSAALREEAGWDQTTLVAMATGRLPFGPSDAALMERHGLRRLALG